MKKYILFILCTAFVLAGCGGNGGKSVTEGDFSYADMQIGYDAQPCFDDRIPDVTGTENGYYYIERADGFECLMYLDKESGQAVPVCSKADCKHLKDENCDAVFNHINEGASFERIDGVWYYEGNIYTIGSSAFAAEDGLASDYYVYQISMDGSKRTKFINLFEGGAESFYTYFHRGYIYFGINKEIDELTFYRVKLEKDAEIEEICRFDDCEAMIYNFEPYKNGLAFIYSYFTDETYSEMISKIKFYNPDNGEITDLAGDTYAQSLKIFDGKMYYCQENDLYVYDMKSGKEKHLYTFEYPVTLSFDGKYLYAENHPAYINNKSEHYIHVLETDGTLVDSIKAEVNFICNFGDQEYMFQRFDSGDGFWVFDKSMIGSGSQEWRKLYSFD